MISFIIFVMIFVPLSQFTHELGHAIVAKHFQANLVKIYLGKGKLVIHKKVFGIYIYIYAFIWVGAYTTGERNDPYKTAEKVLISVAGPICNGLLAVILLILYISGYNNIVIQLTFAFNIWLCLINCIPFKIGQMESDGYTIYKML